MRIACVLIEHFAAAVSERQRPELAGVPFVVGGYPHERKVVYDLSPAAAGYGVARGMPLREACQRCPQAVFLPLDEEGYRRAFADVLTALEAFTPAVEAEDVGCAYLDLRHLALPRGGEPNLAVEILEAVRAACGLEPGVGLARGVFVAKVAALKAGAGRTLAIAPGAERSLLSPLPLSALPLSAEALRRLRLLGLDTVGAFADLRADAVAAYLGAEGTAAHRLANGIDERKVRPRRRIRAAVEEREFEEPLGDEERLALAVAHLVDQLLPKLQQDYLLCQRVEVGLRLANGETRTLAAHLHEPSQEGEAIARAVRRLVAASSLQSGIAAIKLSLLEHGGAWGSQLSLFAPRQGKLEKLAEAAAHLRKRFGDGRLRKAVIVDAGTLLPERRFGFVEYR